MKFPDTLADGALIIQDGVHKHVNRAITKTTGYSLEEHKNTSLGNLTSPEMKDTFRRDFGKSWREIKHPHCI